MGVTIYGLVDPSSNQLRYVGQTHFDLSHRLKGHLSRARKQERKSPVFCWLRKVLERGNEPEIFEIETCETNDEADAAEEFFIQYYRSIGCRLTNHATGGRVNRGFKHSAAWSAEASRRRKGVSGLANKGKRRTPEQKAKISAATKAAWTRHPHPAKGRVQPEETKEKIRATLLARDSPIADSTRAALSTASKRFWKDPEYRRKIIRTGEKHHYFRKRSPEHVMAAAHAASRRQKGVPKSEEHKRRIQEGLRATYAARRAAKADQVAGTQLRLFD